MKYVSLEVFVIKTAAILKILQDDGVLVIHPLEKKIYFCLFCPGIPSY